MPADEEKVLGKGSEIEFNGKYYRMAPVTYDIQCEFSSWLKRRAVLAIQEQRPYLDDDEYERKMDRVDRNMAAGIYAFGGDLAGEASQTPDGIKELVRLCLKKNHPEVTESWVDKLFEAKIDEIGRTLGRANADPKAKAPAKKSSSGAATSRSRKSAKSSVTTPSGLLQSRSAN